jgi:signal transduction histidine kinase
MTRCRIATRLLRGLALRHMELRGRLMWLAMLPVLVFAVVWGIYVIRQRDADLAAQLQQRAQLLARQLAVAADYGIFSFNQAALDNLAQGVLRESSVISATIIGADGQVLATRHAQAQGKAIPPGTLQSMLEASRRSGGGGVSEQNAQWVAHLEPVRTPLLVVDDLPEPSLPQRSDTLHGHAIVQVSTHSIQTELFEFGSRVMVLLAGVLLSGWVMARRFSNNIDQRIQAVVQAAQKIGAGHIGIRLPASTIPSFARLSQDINSMAGQLEQSRQRLEQRVHEATQALREQRDAAQQASRDKTRFLAAASHDLRQPMHALNMLLEAMKQESRPDERAKLLERIEASSQAMSALLDALLDISRLDAGSVRFQLGPFELQPLLRRLRDTYESEAERRGIALVVHGSRAWVRSDPMLLERILGNFLSNALRYTPVGGCVLLAVRTRGENCVIQVRDNGPGIALQEQASVFQEFVQLHNPQRDRSQGLGLGLAIVQRLAQLLHHPVGVRSCVGSGATFHIQLPRCEVAAPPPTPPSGPPWNGASTQASAGLDGCRILLVEDDALVRDSYARLLQLWGCDARVHANADSVFAALGQDGWRPHLIVTDHRLGGALNGRQLIDALRHRWGADLPAAIMTGDTEDADLGRAGTDQLRVLYKPVKPNELRQVLVQLWREGSGTAPA